MILGPPLPGGLFLFCYSGNASYLRFPLSFYREKATPDFSWFPALLHAPPVPSRYARCCRRPCPAVLPEPSRGWLLYPTASKADCCVQRISITMRALRVPVAKRKPCRPRRTTGFCFVYYLWPAPPPRKPPPLEPPNPPPREPLGLELPPLGRGPPKPAVPRENPPPLASLPKLPPDRLEPLGPRNSMNPPPGLEPGPPGLGPGPPG